jgi:hypothetical protein
MTLLLQSKNTSQICARSDLTLEQRDGMFALLSQHFEGVKRSQFEQDLREKNWVILLYNESIIVGFSTILAYESSYQDEPVSLIYSGDTIVAPKAWGTTALSRSWISCVRSLRAHYPQGKYYWMLITSGFRTYRFLPVFWRRFYPSFDNPNDKAAQSLMDILARERFGEQYDRETGIVRFKNPQRLCRGLEEVPEGRLGDSHVRFFLKKNPGYIRGDELVCLTELADENLTAAGERMIS